MENPIISRILSDESIPVEYREYIESNGIKSLDSFQGTCLEFLRTYEIREKIAREKNNGSLHYLQIKKLVSALTGLKPDEIIDCHLIYFVECNFGMYSNSVTGEIYAVFKSSPIKGGFMNPIVINNF